MERFINKEVIILKDNERGIVSSISKDDQMITINTPSRVRKFDLSVIINNKVVFVDEELNEMAPPFFNELKEYFIELENARDKEEAERYEAEHYAKIRRIVGDSNVAFKCTYCDGGCSSNSIGFKGPCSPDIREFNVNHRYWCGSKDCRCRKLLDNEMSLEEFNDKAYVEEKMEFLCYESRMLKDWVCYAGMEEKTGEPMALNKARVGSLAIMTTRPIVNGIEASQEETQVFGVFLIAKHSDNTAIGGSVSSHPKYHIELTPEESKQILFWKYHANTENKTKAFWGTGLHRYISDMECCQILKDIVKVIKDKDKKALAQELLDKFSSEAHIENIPEPNGALTL